MLRLEPGGGGLGPFPNENEAINVWGTGFRHAWARFLGNGLFENACGGTQRRKFGFNVHGLKNAKTAATKGNPTLRCPFDPIAALLKKKILGMSELTSTPLSLTCVRKN